MLQLAPPLETNTTNNATSLETPSSLKIDVIDGLRGIAIFMVVYQHTFARELLTILPLPFIFNYGWVGVNLFFILSGFVLAKPYILNQRSFTSFRDVRGFYIRRAIRLYPLFIFTSVFSTATLGFSLTNTTSLILSLTTLSMFTADNIPPVFNGVTWSLVVEIWFSLAFPVLIYLANRYGILKLSCVVFATALFTRIAVTVFMANGDPNIVTLRDCFLGRMDDFLLGIILCFLYYKRPALFTTLARFHPALFGILLLLSGNLLRELSLNGSGIAPNFTIAFTNWFYQAGFALIIISALKRRSSVTGWLTRLRVLNVPGKMCYSIYLWHNLFIWIVFLNFSFLNCAVYFLILALIVPLSYRFIEFNRLTKHFSHKLGY